MDRPAGAASTNGLNNWAVPSRPGKRIETRGGTPASGQPTRHKNGVASSLSRRAAAALAGREVSCGGGAHRKSQPANVLASGKVTSSPASPCAGRASASLCAAAGGSGRSLALRCARRLRACAGDGQADATGGGSELQMCADDADGCPALILVEFAQLTTTSEDTHGKVYRIGRSHTKLHDGGDRLERSSPALDGTRDEREGVGRIRAQPRGHLSAVHGGGTALRVAVRSAGTTCRGAGGDSAAAETRHQERCHRRLASGRATSHPLLDEEGDQIAQSLLDTARSRARLRRGHSRNDSRQEPAPSPAPVSRHRRGRKQLRSEGSPILAETTQAPPAPSRRVPRRTDGCAGTGKGTASLQAHAATFW